jgi:DNA-binding NarL/FixJ family response regulator
MGELKFLTSYNYLEHHKVTENNKHSLDKIKDFLNFFNFQIEDIPKLITFSQKNTKEKKFRIKHLDQFNSLTSKELEIFKLVILGKQSNEIASLLFVETYTVSTHRKHIKQKLGLDSILDIYKYAKCFNIIDF